MAEIQPRVGTLRRGLAVVESIAFLGSCDLLAMNAFSQTAPPRPIALGFAWDRSARWRPQRSIALATLGLVWLAAIGLVGDPAAAQAEIPAETTETTTAPPAAATPPRTTPLRPAFFEESRRQQGRGGFSNSFLGDALDGRADSLGRTSTTTGAARSPSQAVLPVSRSAEGLVATPSAQPATPVQPGPPVTTPVPPTPPSFDRTSVIIRR